MVPDADYRIKLQVFEGPLDLLLFLIRKNELDIYDIPIESVTRQYIDALHQMQQLDLDVAGEFFVMAATLMEIKSRLLLPKGLHAVDPNAEDEEVDPRWELVHQLIQYKKFKDAAGGIAQLIENRQNLLPRLLASSSEPDAERPLRGVDRIELWNTFNIVLRRLAEKLVVGEIHDEQTTVSDQMEWLLNRTRTENRYSWLHHVSPLQVGAMLRPESPRCKGGSVGGLYRFLNRKRPFQGPAPSRAIHHHRPLPLAGRDKGSLFGFQTVMICPGGAIHAMARHGLQLFGPTAPQHRERAGQKIHCHFALGPQYAEPPFHGQRNTRRRDGSRPPTRESEPRDGEIRML